MAPTQMIAAQKSIPSPWHRRAEWLENAPAVLLIVAGLVWRLVSAHARFLNADEAMHYLLARQGSVVDAYRASLGTAHPPLLIILLYYWARISSTEFFLRLPSVAAGTASGWFLYAWLHRVRDRATALIAMALLLFSPALIYTSAEVRQYALALCFMSAALYLLERALMANSAPLMLASGVSLYLALLVHYSALIFAPTMALYGLLRIVSAHRKFPFVTAWAVSQAGAAAIATFLWKTHIAAIRHRPLIQDVAGSYLRSSLFHPRQENALLFLVRATLRLFHFLFSQGTVSAIAIVLFLAGIVLLFKRTNLTQWPAASSRQLAILLLTPLVINGATALVGLYPYGGTRHDSYLALFIMPAVAVPIACWKTSSPWTKPLIIAAVLAVANFTVRPAGAYIKASNQKKELMDRAVHYLQASARPGSILLTDYESGLLLSYYLCHGDITHPGVSIGTFYGSSCGAYESVALLPRLWVFRAASFPAQLDALEKTLPEVRNRELWLFQAGFIVDREPEFQALLTHYGCATPEKFGANILLCRIGVPASRAVPKRDSAEHESTM
jgi:hypothetical protein